MGGFAWFMERNDWEGEVWRWYIPLAGNTEALRKLDVLIGEHDGDEYELNMRPIAEAEVDARVAGNSDDGYYAAHNKLSGRLVVPDVDTSQEHWADDVLYKGRVTDFMVTPDAHQRRT